MDKTIKEKWVRALNSGVYQQGKCALKRVIDGQATYCCLGVLCDVMDLEWKKTNIGANYNNGDHLEYIETFEPEWEGEQPIPLTGSLSQNLLKKTGLELFEHDKLIDLNDDEGAEFHQIAGWIEDNL